MLSDEQKKIADSDPNARFIQLTKGQFAVVDANDFERISQRKWHANWNRRARSYYASGSVWQKAAKRRMTLHMAREITQAKPGEFVDHINHDTLDNRQSNLRICSSAQNNANACMKRNNTSRVKGVSWSKNRNQWHAKIQKDGKTINLGRFASLREAALAYDAKALELFGSYALTNAMLGTIPDE